MTKAVRESGFCIGESYFEKGKVIWGCQKGLEEISKTQRTWMECETWDAEVFEACESCPLICDKNKRKKTQRKEIEAALSQIKVTAAGFGISAEQIERISEAYSNVNSVDKEQLDALKSAKIANDAIQSISNGKVVDISALSALKDKENFKLIRKRKRAAN